MTLEKGYKENTFWKIDEIEKKEREREGGERRKKERKSNKIREKEMEREGARKRGIHRTGKIKRVNGQVRVKKKECRAE